jgi:uncharacterized membrane protein YphA (DoxX/SURF4 family)
MSPKVLVYLLLLRWVIAGIFIANGVPKILGTDPNFGTNAISFFQSLEGHIWFAPYSKFFTTVVLQNVYIFAFLVKWAEVILGGAFLIGFPLSLATFIAIFLHVNYIFVASIPLLVFLNVLMISAELLVNELSKSK